MSTSYTAQDVLLYMALKLNRAWNETRANLEELWWQDCAENTLGFDLEDGAEFPPRWQRGFQSMEELEKEVNRRLLATGICSDGQWGNLGIPCKQPPRTYSDGSPVYVYVGTDYYDVGDPLHTEPGDYQELGYYRLAVLMFPGETDNDELAKIRRFNNVTTDKPGAPGTPFMRGGAV